MLPAIYQFEIPDLPKECRWGWHRAADTLEAANNILHSRGETAMEPKALCAKYAHIDPYPKIGIFETPRALLEVTPDGQIVDCRSATHEWLEWAVKEDHFIPAKLGLALINAVKQNNAVTAIRRALKA